MGALECDDGNTISGDGCNSRCKIEPGYNCTGGTSHTKDTCYKLSPVTVEVFGNEVENPAFITIKFSENVIFKGNFKDILLVARLPDRLPFQNYTVTKINDSYYQLNMGYYPYQKASGLFTVELLKPENVVDVFGNVIVFGYHNVVMNFDYTPDKFTVIDGLILGSKTIIGLVFLFGLSIGRKYLTWMCIESVQFVYLTRFLIYGASESLRQTYDVVGVLGFNFMPNPLKEIKMSIEHASQIPPQKFLENNLPSSFFHNSGNYMILLIAILFLTLV